MSNARLLIVHSEPSALALLRSMLYTAGMRIDEAASDREAVRMLDRAQVDLVVAVVDPTDPDALELLGYIRRKHPHIPLVLLFTAPSPDRAREAMQRGVSSVLRFPVPANELRAAVAQALERSPGALCTAAPVAGPIGKPLAANGKSATNGATPVDRAAEGEILQGQDPVLLQTLELASAVAPMRTPVLILGERGTGRSTLARILHQRSPRRAAPFLELPCGTLKEAHLERELFGQAMGGFGDRVAIQPGRLAQAHGGTLFLDEVAALSPDLQFKLHRLLQEMAFEPVNSTQTVRVDVRLIVSSSEDLPLLVAQGRFRQDLYDRISAVTLKLPPLRQRGSDIDLLAHHFRAWFARENGKEVTGFAPEALTLLTEHTWPGNVRELRNAVERGVIVCRGPKITPAHLALSSNEPRIDRSRPVLAPRPHIGLVGIRPLKEALEEPEKQIILQALEALSWNRQETARVLDINRTTLYKKMKKYGLLVNEPAWMT